MNISSRTPDSFPSAHFVGADFDNTIALTGSRVEEAYEHAVEAVFGTQALETYRAARGLHNRAPIEVVRQLAPESAGEEEKLLLSKLDGAKLDKLMSEIGTEWPEPTRGFIAFAQALQARQKDAPPINSIIISSGHAPFIERTFDVWGIAQPDDVLAQEKLADLAERDDIALPTKPNGIIMLYAYNAWRALHRLPKAQTIDSKDTPRMIYAGDDPVKDGELAVQNGISFMLIRPEDAAQTWQEIALHCGLGQLALLDK